MRHWQLLQWQRRSPAERMARTHTHTDSSFACLAGEAIELRPDGKSEERAVKSKLVRINQAFKTCLATQMSSKDACHSRSRKSEENRSQRISNGFADAIGIGIDIDAAPEIVVHSFPYAILCNCGASQHTLPPSLSRSTIPYPAFAPVTCPETVCDCTQLINLKSLHLFIQQSTATASQIIRTTKTEGNAKGEIIMVTLIRAEDTKNIWTAMVRRMSRSSNVL